MDDRERERTSSSKADEVDDGDEYELEPPDPTVLAEEQRRAQEALESTRMSIDIDEIYREVERDRGREIIEKWFRGRSFRFQIKHLLIATAVLAILLTLAKLDMMILVVIGVMVSIVGIYLYFQWEEKKHQDEADRRRQELYARRRAQRGQQFPSADAVPATAEPAAPFEPPPLIQSEVDEIWEKAQAEQKFEFRFSMQQLLAAMTAAAVIFGAVHLGGASNAATLLGLAALLGLVVHALGYEPPSMVVLAWWFILVLYVFLSFASFMWSGLT
jgi:hypothetical protein